MGSERVAVKANTAAAVDVCTTDVGTLSLSQDFSQTDFIFLGVARHIPIITEQI